MRLPTLRRRLDLRLALGVAFFIWAALIFVWPVHAAHASSATLDRRSGRVTIGDVSSQTCPYDVRIGYTPTAQRSGLGPDTDATSYALDSFNDDNCFIVRDNRARQALFYTVIGAGLTISALKRRRRRERTREMAVLAATG
jgi:hypothetical protein